MELSVFSKTSRIIVVITVVFLTIFSSSFSQGRGVSILEVNPDARSASMGNISLMNTDRNFLYVNPSSILYSDITFTVGINGLLYPKQSNTTGRLIYGNASFGYRFAERHATFVGYRYEGCLSVPVVSGQFDMGEQKSIKPYDMVADVAYAFKVSDKISVFTIGSFINSKIVETGYAGVGNFGVNFRTELGSKRDAPILLNLSTGVFDFGSKLYYNYKTQVYPPSSVKFAADLLLPLASEHNINCAFGGRYFFLPQKSQLFTAGIGAEYNFKQLVSARVGYRYGQNDLYQFTIGGGISYAGLKLDFANIIGNRSIGAKNMIISLIFNY